MNTHPTPETISHSQRICFVAPFGLRLKGTVRARILPLARGLAQRGHEVMLLIPPWDSPEDAGKGWEDGGVRIVNVSVKGGLLPTLGRMVAEIRGFGPDILHIVKPRAHAGLIQWLIWHFRSLAGRQTLRIFLDIDDWEQAWEDVAGYSWPLARFLAWQEEWGIRHAHGITAASRWLEMRVNDYAPDTPILYLPNGVPVNDAPILSRQPSSGQPPTLLLFSRFVEVDPAWMGEFWTAMQQKVPNVRLIVAGQAIQPHHEAAMRIVIEARHNPVHPVHPAQSDLAGLRGPARPDRGRGHCRLRHLPRGGSTVEPSQVQRASGHAVDGRAARGGQRRGRTDWLWRRRCGPAGGRRRLPGGFRPGCGGSAPCTPGSDRFGRQSPTSFG